MTDRWPPKVFDATVTHDNSDKPIDTGMDADSDSRDQQHYCNGAIPDTQVNPLYTSYRFFLKGMESVIENSVIWDTVRKGEAPSLILSSRTEVAAATTAMLCRSDELCMYCGGDTPLLRDFYYDLPTRETNLMWKGDKQKETDNAGYAPVRADVENALRGFLAKPRARLTVMFSDPGNGDSFRDFICSEELMKAVEEDRIAIRRVQKGYKMPHSVTHFAYTDGGLYLSSDIWPDRRLRYFGMLDQRRLELMRSLFCKIRSYTRYVF